MKDFIETELQKLKQNYMNLPLTIISDYKNEVEKMKDYNGRQLLEMLQNADDESENTDNKTAYIELNETHLVIANNGNPFSVGGLESLMYSNVSPKAKQQNKIGHKGTGFRSILSWAKSVYIKSNGLSVEFSRPNSIEFLKEMIQEKPEIQEILQGKTDEPYPIAILKTPMWQDGAGDQYNSFDTYIVVEINEDNKEDIQTQMEGLELEVLLFLPNLKKIILKSPENTRIIDKEIIDEGRVSISLVEDGRKIQEKTWSIRKREGTYNGQNFELKMAYTDKLDDNVHLLYSYFKTNVSLPFPAIFHGTFELTGNRNQLIISDTNKYLLSELIQLMINTAVEITKSHQQVSWDALKLLAFDNTLDQNLLNMKFDSGLIEKIKENPLYPVISGKYITYNEKPVRYLNPYSDILPSDKFLNLTLHTTDEQILKLLNKIGNFKYSPSYFFKTLSEISPEFTIEQRAKCIHYLTQDYNEELGKAENAALLHIFIDQSGKLIQGNTELFFPPGSMQIKMPAYANIHFIHEDLYKALLEEFGVQSGVMLTHYLDVFDVQVYSLETVLRRTISQARLLLKKKKANKKGIIKELLESLLHIYQNGDEDLEFPTSLNVPLMNRHRKIMDAKRLYFGKEYHCEITENLLGPVAKDHFAGSQKILGLDKYEKAEIKEFLQWIGVAQYPRISVKRVHERDYELDVLKNITYPLVLEGESYQSYEELLDILNSRCVMNVESADKLEDILSKAAFEDILIWLMRDPAVSRVISEGVEHNKNSHFNMYLYRKLNHRTLKAQHIKSYLLWKLQTSSWIENADKKKVPSARCCLSKAIGPEFSPLIEVPFVNVYQDKFKENKITIQEIEAFLLKIGIGPDLRYFSSEVIYSILLKLSELDPEGKLARSIYKQIIMSRPHLDEDNMAYQKFLQEGKVLVKLRGERMYSPVSEAYYVENRTYCEEIMKQFPILELDKRSGKQLVRKNLGVQSLEGLRFKLTDNPDHHFLNDRFKIDFEEFKPYIYAYRLEKDNKHSELERLKKLKIHLCTDIQANFIHQKQEKPFHVQNYEYISMNKGYEIYLKLKNDQYLDLQELRDDFRFSEAIAEIIAGVIKVEENRKDYREMYSKKISQREELIRLELEDEQLQKLQQARSLLGITTDPQRIFWMAIFKGTKVKLESINMDDEETFKKTITDTLHLEQSFLEELWTTFDYEDPASHNNASLLIQLFREIRIDITKFNQFMLIEVDLTDYYLNELERIKLDYRELFFTHLFQKLKKGSIEEKEGLIKEWDKYTYFTDFSIDNSVSFNCNSCFSRFLKSEFEMDIKEIKKVTKLDLGKLYHENEELLRDRLEKIPGSANHQIDKFIEKQSVSSLLYFGEFSYLLEKFTESITKAKKDRKYAESAATIDGIDQEDHDDYYSNIFHVIKNQPVSYQITNIKTAKEEHNIIGKGKGHGRSSRGAHIPSQKVTEEIGFIGEAYVYLTLCQKYGKENVHWVSENAKRAKVNEHGNHEENYDLCYKDRYGKLKYVEVKSSVGKDFVFHISRQEVAFGELMKDAYDIFFVSNVKSETREIRRAPRFFKYKKDESFNQNSRFNVENSNFVIKFQEDKKIK